MYDDKRAGRGVADAVIVFFWVGNPRCCTGVKRFHRVSMHNPKPSEDVLTATVVVCKTPKKRKRRLIGGIYILSD
jgi:hypothetical protein